MLLFSKFFRIKLELKINNIKAETSSKFLYAAPLAKWPSYQVLASYYSVGARGIIDGMLNLQINKVAESSAIMKFPSRS